MKLDELIHHSDRSVQYAYGDYIDRPEKAGILPSSMGRAGCPHDNALAESFMKTLKAGEVDAAQYATSPTPEALSPASSTRPQSAETALHAVACHFARPHPIMARIFDMAP